MDDLVLNYEAWDGVRSIANGTQRVAQELQKELAQPGNCSLHAKAKEMAFVVERLASMLVADLEAISPAWAARFEIERGEAQGRTKRRRANSSQLLLASGRIREGSEIVVDPRRLPAGGDATNPVFRARFTRRGNKVLWTGTGEEVSLSALTVLLRDLYGVDVNRGNVNGFKYWCLAENPSRTLWELGEENA